VADIDWPLRARCLCVLGRLSWRFAVDWLLAVGTTPLTG
jgi:hypothetical protein